MALKVERPRCGDQSAPGENEDRFSNAFAAFSEHWPGTSEEEFRTFVQDTSMAFGNSEEFVLADMRQGYDVAAFVVQVGYMSDGSYDLAARNEITRAAEAAGSQR